jgi:hypothetical protein
VRVFADPSVLVAIGIGAIALLVSVRAALVVRRLVRVARVRAELRRAAPAARGANRVRARLRAQVQSARRNFSGMHQVLSADPRLADNAVRIMTDDLEHRLRETRAAVDTHLATLDALDPWIPKGDRHVH